MNPCRVKMFPLTRHALRRGAAVLLAAGLATTGAMAQQADPACGNPFANSFGPYDYRTDRGQNLKVVEDFHFNPRVEALIRGQSGTVAGDLDYVLRAFPNHHRALVSMMRLGARTKGIRPQGAQFDVECYFKRALTFRPDDAVARMIYVQYLTANGRKPEAAAQLDQVVTSNKDSAITQHNAGLLYLEMGDTDKALAQAHRAAALGMQEHALKRQLQAAGKWVEPPQQAADGAASSSAASTPPMSAASSGGAASVPSR